MASTTTLWDDVTFNGPFIDGKIASSAEIANNNSENSAKVTIEYKLLDPDGKDALVGFLIQAVLEEEITSGVWVPIATQDDLVKGTDEALTQVIDFSPQVLLNPGVPEKLFVGNVEAAAISRHDGVAPGNMRVCLFEHDQESGHPLLTSIKLSGYIKLFTK